jgi:tetratricopeptide (TPR) repeat protein/HEAT repeat protein
LIALNSEFQILCLLDSIVSGLISSDEEVHASAFEAAAGTGEPALFMIMEGLSESGRILVESGARISQTSARIVQAFSSMAESLRDDLRLGRLRQSFDDYRKLEFRQSLAFLENLEEILQKASLNGTDRDSLDSIEILKVIVLLEQNPLIREKAFRGMALASALEPGTMGFVTPFLRHQNPRVRSAAISAISLVKEADSLLLLGFFDDGGSGMSNLPDIEKAFSGVPWVTLAVAMAGFSANPELAHLFAKIMKQRPFSPLTPVLWDMSQHPDSGLSHRGLELLKDYFSNGLSGEDFLQWVQDFPSLPVVQSVSDLRKLGNDDLKLWLEYTIEGETRGNSFESSVELILDKGFLDALDPEMRRLVLQTAGRMGAAFPDLCSRIIPPLIRFCSPEGVSVSFRSMAAEALAMLPPRSGIDETIVTLSTSGDLKLVSAACHVAARHSPGKLPDILTSLSDEFGRRGEMAAAALAGELRVRDWLGSLTSLLSSREDAVRDCARRSLEKLAMAGTSQARRILRDRQQDAVEASASSGSAESLVKRLRRRWLGRADEMGAIGEEIATALFEINSHIEPNRLNALVAIENLCRNSETMASETIVDILDNVVFSTWDNTMVVREKAFRVAVALKIAAGPALEVSRPAPAGMPPQLFRAIFRRGLRAEKIRTLHSLVPGCRDLVEQAVDSLGEEGDPFVRASLCRAIGLAGSSDDSIVLLPFFGDGDGRVRANAVEGMVLSAGEKAFSLIVPMLRDSTPRVQRNVRNGLGLLDPATAADTLVGLSRSDDSDLRLFAAYTMGILGQKNSMVYVGILKSMLAREGSRNVCARIIKSLVKIYSPYPETVSSAVFSGLVSREGVPWKKAMLQWGMEKAANRETGSIEEYVRQSDDDGDDAPLDPRFAFTTIMELPPAPPAVSSPHTGEENGQGGSMEAAQGAVADEEDNESSLSDLEARLIEEASMAGMEAVNAIKSMAGLGEEVSPVIIDFLAELASGGGPCDRLAYFAFRSLKALDHQRASKIRRGADSSSSSSSGIVNSENVISGLDSVSLPSVSLTEILFSASGNPVIERADRIPVSDKVSRSDKLFRSDKVFGSSRADGSDQNCNAGTLIAETIAEDTIINVSGSSFDAENDAVHSAVPEHSQEENFNLKEAYRADSELEISEPEPEAEAEAESQAEPAEQIPSMEPVSGKIGKSIFTGTFRNLTIFAIMVILIIAGHGIYRHAVYRTLIRQGLINARQGHHDKARELLETAYSRGAREAVILAVMADIHFWFGRERDSERLVDALAREYPKSREYERFLARTALTGNRTGEAMDRYGRILAIHPDYCRARYEYALAHRDAGMADRAAEEALRIFQFEPDNIDSMVLMATIHEDALRLKEAVTWSLRALRVNSSYPPAIVRHASILYRSGRCRESAQFYDQAIQLYKTMNWNTLDLQYPLAMALMDSAEDKRAGQIFMDLLRDRPGDLESGLSLGVLFGRQGKREEELALYKSLLVHHPNDSRLLYNIGLLYYNSGDEVEALNCFESAVRDNRNFAMAFFNAAVLRHRAGDLEGARRHYQRVCEIEPVNARAEELLRKVSSQLQSR